MKRYIFTGIFLLSTSAFAHVPYVEGLDFQNDEAFKIPGPIEQSLGIYLRFDSDKDVDEARFTLTPADLESGNADLARGPDGQRGRRVFFNTIVPRCAPYASVLPQLALVGPAQAALSSTVPEGLPFTVGTGEGVYLLENKEQGQVFNEGVSGTSYWQQNEASFILTQAGSYRLYVWEPSGQIADYALVFGNKEIFKSSDILQSIKRIEGLRKGEEIKDEACRLEATQK